MLSERSKGLIVPIAALALLGAAAAPTALGAGATPAAKEAFSGRPAIYLWFEITETGAREFGAGAPKDALLDAAHRIQRSVKFEVPLDMAIPGSPPRSSLSAEPTAMLEEGRFVGWMAVPPEDSGAEEQFGTGKIDPSRNLMFLPVKFTVDDVRRFRRREDPADGWRTKTRTSKGRGIAYIGRSGMLLCDLGKMTCDIDNVSLDYQEGTDLLTVTSISDVPGFVPTKETVAPGLSLPKIPAGLVDRLTAFPLTLPEPSTLTFSGPSSGAAGGGGASDPELTVTVKVTLSAKPAPKSAAGPR